THGNHIAAVNASRQSTPVEEGWVHLLFLPLAHSFARLESFLGVAHGLTTAFAENLDKVGENLREVRPHFICSVPRVFEKVYAKILSGVEAGSPVKRKIFHWAVGVGRDVSRHQQRAQPVPSSLEWRRKLAHKLVFSKLHAALGGRLRWAVSGGAPLARDIAEFFHAAGILLLEGYGLTETCPALTFNPPDRFTFGAVRQTRPGVQPKADPFISQVMVYGDRRPYPVALITVNPEELSKFAHEQGILTSETAVIVKHPKVVERIGRTVEEKNTQLQSYAKIKRFTVLATD